MPSYLRCQGEIFQDPMVGFPSCSTDWEVIQEDVLLSATPIHELFELMETLFRVPEPGEMTAFFVIGFSTPLSTFIIARAIAGVYNMIR
jgi:hypothetical protein